MRQCYTLEDYKKVLKFDVDHDKCLQTKPKLDKQIKLYKESADALNRALSLQKDSLKLLQDDRTHWFEKWKEENKKRHIAENKPAFGSYLAWGAAGAFAVATAVLTSIVVLKD